MILLQFSGVNIRYFLADFEIRDSGATLLRFLFVAGKTHENDPMMFDGDRLFFILNPDEKATME